MVHLMGPSFRLGLSALIVMAVLGACDSPDRLRTNIPNGLPTGATVYYNTKWFECAVAIFPLEPGFAERLRQPGISQLNEATENSWRETPVWGGEDSSGRWTTDLIESLACIEDQELQALFSSLADGTRGYFQVQPNNSATLIASEEGLILIGGYE